jgi:four helix bundle protein
MSAKSFEELEIWKLARQLTGQIYSITSEDTFSDDFGLRNQLRRASVSVMSNISEGFERDGNQELIHFLSMAKGSCGEVRCQLYVAMDNKCLKKQRVDLLIDDFKKLSSMISNFIRYLKNSDLKGIRYKKI